MPVLIVCLDLVESSSSFRRFYPVSRSKILGSSSQIWLADLCFCHLLCLSDCRDMMMMMMMMVVVVVVVVVGNPGCGPHPGTTSLIHTSKRPLTRAWLQGGAAVSLRAGYTAPSQCCPGSRRAFLGGATGSLQPFSSTRTAVHQVK